jgi:hypothetical protein
MKMGTGDFVTMDEVTVLVLGGVVIAGLPFYVMAATAAATSTVKLINECFSSATEKQITETLTPPAK